MLPPNKDVLYLCITVIIVMLMFSILVITDDFITSQCKISGLLDTDLDFITSNNDAGINISVSRISGEFNIEMPCYMLLTLND